MDLQGEFEQAAVRSRTLGSQSNETMLELYGLYKQAVSGDVSGERPGGFDFVGAAKHDAWAARRGLTREQAMRAYVELVQRLAGG